MSPPKVHPQRSNYCCNCTENGRVQVKTVNSYRLEKPGTYGEIRLCARCDFPDPGLTLAKLDPTGAIK